MAELGRKEAEQLIKEILTEYARKIRSAKKKEYTSDVQPLFSPDIDAFYKLVKSEDMDFYIFNRLNDEGIRQLLVGCRRLAKCYELDSYGKIKDFTYEPESPKCRIASDSGGKYTAGGSYTFTLEGKAELGNKWYEPYRVVWHFYRENPGTGKYEETASKMDEARALADFDTWDRSFLVSEKGRYKVTATIFNQAITTGIRPDIVEVCELYFEAEERNIAALSYSDKIRIAIEYSNVSNEILEEIGDLNKLAIQLAGVFLVMAVLTASGLGAVAEALGIVLLVTSAAISGTQLLAGIIELKDFLSKVNDAKTDDDLKACGKIFGDAVAKIGVDGLFFVLSIFGLKKASAKLTTRTVVDNGLNAGKWKGKKIADKVINIEELKPTSQKFSSWEEMKNYYKDKPEKVTEFLHKNKPKYSPVPQKWFNKGGTLEIQEINGDKIWTYINKNGDSVPYINGYIKFPEKYLHPDFREINIGNFSGKRYIDNEKLLEILKSDYGVVEVPDGYIPHHDINNGVFQFVEESIHNEFTHIGGNSLHGGN